MDAEKQEGIGELNHLAGELLKAAVDREVRGLHSVETHFDGTSKLQHLEAVSELSGRYANRFFAEADLFEQRYMVIVCRTAGLLHESMMVGLDFEQIVELTNETVARVVSDITPDQRYPWPKRLELYANRIGLARAETQIIKLADLQHSIRAAAMASPERRPVAEKAVEEAKMLIDSFNKIEDDFDLGYRVKTLAADVKALDHRFKER